VSLCHSHLLLLLLLHFRGYLFCNKSFGKGVIKIGGKRMHNLNASNNNELKLTKNQIID